MPKAAAKPFTDEEIIGLMTLRLCPHAESMPVSFVISLESLASFRKRFKVSRSGRNLKSNVFDVITVMER